MKKNLSTEEMFDGVAGFIAESRALLEADKLLELDGLEHNVAVLCEAVLRLSQEERVHYADRLQLLLNDLNALGKEMSAKRDQVAGEIKHLSRHKQASSAYRVTDASDRRPDDEPE